MHDYTHLKLLANESFADLPDWHPDFGLTEQQKNFSMAAGPQVVLDLIAENERLQSELTQMTTFRDNAANHMCRIRGEATAFERERDQFKAEVEALRKDAERYRWLCDRFGITKLPCAVERILSGDIYVADGKSGVDCAIDAAMSKEAGLQKAAELRESAENKGAEGGHE